MRSATAKLLFVLFVCLAVIGVVSIAGYARWQEYQAQQQRLLEQQAYVDALAQPFDTLCDLQTALSDDMLSGSADRETLFAALASIGAPLDTLAETQAPAELSEAQRHFSEAAASYHAMQTALTGLLSDDSLHGAQLRDRLMQLLPEAVETFDHLRYGIDVLQEQQELTVPEQATQLRDAISELMNGDLTGMLS